MEKLNNWITTIIGILLILPLIGVDQLGSVVGTGIAAWLTAIGVLVIGIMSLVKG